MRNQLTKLRNPLPEHAAAWPWTGPLPPRCAAAARRSGRSVFVTGREILRAGGPFEWVSLAYFGILNLLILLFHHNVPRAGYFYLRHIAIAAMVLGLCWAAQRWPSPALRLVRDWYPHLFFLFCFEELHYLVQMIFPRWFDEWLIRFDYALLGVHPTAWLQQFSAPRLNDLMQSAYMTYFFYLIVLGGMLYAKKQMRAYWAMMTSTAVAYYSGYLTGIFFPIESPFHALAELHTAELSGGAATALINFLESFGRVHGAAFPSAHVSGSFVALLGAWRYRRRLFWIFLPLFLTMLVSTVYGRYHYVADVLAGLIYGAFGFVLGHRLAGWRQASHA